MRTIWNNYFNFNISVLIQLSFDLVCLFKIRREINLYLLYIGIGFGFADDVKLKTAKQYNTKTAAANLSTRCNENQMRLLF